MLHQKARGNQQGNKASTVDQHLVKQQNALESTGQSGIKGMILFFTIVYCI